MRGNASRLRDRRSAAGFGLLEVMLSLAILAGIAGTVFMLAQNTMNQTQMVLDQQREAMHRQAFFDLMRGQFSKLPGNAVVDLTFDDPPGNGPYLSQLTFQNVPLVFSWGGSQFAVKAVQINTVVRRDGLLDVVLNYYDVEILEETNETQDGEQEELDEQAEPIASVTLLEGLRWFEWQVLETRTGEWITEWHNPARQPVFLQLDLAFGGGEENLRQVFWIPPKQNPVALMRQLAAQGGQGGARNVPGGGGQTPPDGGDGGNVTPPAPGGGGQPRIPEGGNPGR